MLTHTAAMEAWDLRVISGFMEISFRVADSAKSILGTVAHSHQRMHGGPLKGVLGPGKRGIQSSLILKPQMTAWNGGGSILTHHDYMVDLCTQLRDAGHDLSDQAFHT